VPGPNGLQGRCRRAPQATPGFFTANCGLKRFQAKACPGLDPGWIPVRITDLGATPWPTSPAEIKAFRDAEETRLLPIMKAAGIKPE
jgi:hypothetical protein